MSQEIIKRLKSFAWRAGVIALLAILNFTSQQLTSFGLPDWSIVMIGLVINEATKWLNNNTGLFGNRLK